MYLLVTRSGLAEEIDRKGLFSMFPPGKILDEINYRAIIIGFAATIFCYPGVNLLLSGLHSYGG